MITSWSIWNFKSIQKRVDLRLPGISILVGANSSGKSSILQTFLLLKQTLQYGSTEVPLLLNGPLVRLGNFNDVRSFLGKKRLFGFAFTLHPSTEALKRRNRTQTALYFPGLTSQTISDVKCSVEFTTKQNETDELALQQPYIINSSVKITYKANNQSVIAELSTKHVIPRKFGNFHELREGGGQQVTELEITEATEDIQQELAQNRPDHVVHGAGSRYFMPEKVLVSFDAKKLAAAELSEYLSSVSSLLSIPPNIRTPAFFEAAKSGVRDWVQDKPNADQIIATVDRAMTPTELNTAALGEQFVLGKNFIPSLHKVHANGGGPHSGPVLETSARICGGIPQPNDNEFYTAAGSNVQLVRDSDGAKARRVHVTGGHLAVRLMYWQHRDGTPELANVGVKGEEKIF